MDDEYRSFDAFVVKHLRGFLWPAAKMMLSRRRQPLQDVDDVLQETLTRCLARWPDIVGCRDEEGLMAFFIQTMSNVVHEQRRDLTKRSEHIELTLVHDRDAGDPGPVGHVMSQVELAIFQEAVGELNESDRLLLELMMSGITDQEIAVELQVSLPTVRQRRSRMRQKLRNFLNKFGFGDGKAREGGTDD
ncbi:RNA polymerase sigma factor [Amycolatopsis sp. NPDC051758]|uniref:RNA polymerase sigma factor n=1 Tax=Amycolatopsis sp. NPDC051758 TaxID=3363935 RepID=UPI0037949806